MEPPDDDDAHWQELEWTLDLLADGLRSPQDVNILRTRNIFERILALYDAPGASKGLQQKALQILHRATCVGGATTLATRAGVLAWSQTQLAENDANGDALRVLAKGIGERVEQERVQQWSRGGFEDEMADIVAVR
ncbi:hypothetical protein H2203_003272 [Taxawa tesnikishii (nom. ined.)]|nr:hypothetical protein H2203_003272 [Dothideales sp. JES 119]